MTIIIVILTSIISYLAFNNRELMQKLQFNSYQIWHKKEYYRLISHGFVHADWTHLIINMFVLFSFGMAVEGVLDQLQVNGWIQFPILDYLLLYLTGIVISSLLSLYKHRDNMYYNAVGASGAVSAVVFLSIFFDPWSKIYFYGIIGIPGIILGIIYLGYSYYMGKKGKDLINHDAHIIGAVYGLVFPLLLDVELLDIFIYGLTNL